MAQRGNEAMTMTRLPRRYEAAAPAHPRAAFRADTESAPSPSRRSAACAPRALASIFIGSVKRSRSS
jgi:hypothetical protein